MQWVLNIATRDGFLKYSDVLLLLSIPVTQIFLILFFYSWGIIPSNRELSGRN